MALQVINPGAGAGAQLRQMGTQAAPAPSGLPSLPRVNTALGPTLQVQDITGKEREKFINALGVYAANQQKMRDNEDLVSALTDLQKSAVDFQTEWKLSHFGVDARDAGSVFSKQVDDMAKDMLEKRFKGRPELASTFRERAAQISLSGFTHGSSYDSQQDLQYRKDQLDGQMATLQGIIATGTPADIDAAAQTYRDSLEVFFPGMDHTKSLAALDKNVYMGMIQRHVTGDDPQAAMAYLDAGMKKGLFSPSEMAQAKGMIEKGILGQAAAMSDNLDVPGLQRLISQYDAMEEREPTASNGKRPYSDLALNEANNNPGNISGKGGVGNGYAAYKTTLDGFRALDKLIQTSYKNMTPATLARKYAPENDPRGRNNPDAYAKQIAQTLGIGVGDTIDVEDPMVRNKLMRSIAKVEGPTSRFNLDEIDYVTGVKEMPAGYQSRDLRKDSKFPNGIPDSEDTNAKTADLAATFNGKIKYQMGAKDPKSGVLDCSGWVGYMLEKSGIKGYRGLHSEAQVVKAMQSGRQVSTDELFSSPKEGIVIGIDSGPRDHDRGRDIGIDHVAYTYKDPQTGQIMVTESAGGKNGGVRNTPVKEWLESHRSKGHQFYAGDITGGKYYAAQGGRQGLSAETRAKLNTMLETAEATKMAQDLAKQVMDGSTKQSDAMAQINAIANPKVQARARAQFGQEMRVKDYMDKELVKQATEQATTFVMGIQDEFEKDPAAAQQKMWEEVKRAENAALTGGKAEKEYAKLMNTAYASLGPGLSRRTNPEDYNAMADQVANAEIREERQLLQDPRFMKMAPKDQNALRSMLTKSQKVDNNALKAAFTDVFGSPNDPLLDKEDKKNRQALWQAVRQDYYNFVTETNSAQDSERMRQFVQKYADPAQISGLFGWTATTGTYGDIRISEYGKDSLPVITDKERAGVASLFASNSSIADMYLKAAQEWKKKNHSWASEEDVAELLFYRSQQEASMRGRSALAKPNDVPDKATWGVHPKYGYGWTWTDKGMSNFKPYVYKVN